MATEQSSIQKQINRNAGIKGGVTGVSVRGRMAGPKSEKGNYRLAGGTTQTVGDGRGGQLTNRRNRYYDVRLGLGLAGG